MGERARRSAQRAIGHADAPISRQRRQLLRIGVLEQLQLEIATPWARHLLPEPRVEQRSVVHVEPGAAARTRVELNADPRLHEVLAELLREHGGAFDVAAELSHRAVIEAPDHPASCPSMKSQCSGSFCISLLRLPHSVSPATSSSSAVEVISVPYGFPKDSP